MPEFRRYLGICVPCSFKERVGAKPITIRFVLKIQVVSKKKNECMILHTQNAKDYLYATFKNRGRISLLDALDAIDMVKCNEDIY